MGSIGRSSIVHMGHFNMENDPSSLNICVLIMTKQKSDCTVYRSSLVSIYSLTGKGFTWQVGRLSLNLMGGGGMALFLVYTEMPI